MLVQVLLLGTMTLLFIRHRARVDLVIIVAFLSVLECLGWLCREFDLVLKWLGLLIADRQPPGCSRGLGMTR